MKSFIMPWEGKSHKDKTQKLVSLKYLRARMQKKKLSQNVENNKNITNERLKYRRQ